MTEKTKIHPRNPEITRPRKNHITRGKCFKCGGRGYGPWMPDGGRCYRCAGSGAGGKIKNWAFPTEWKEDQCTEWLTDHEAKLQAKRDKKAAEKAEAEAVRLDDIAAKNLKAAGVRAMNFKTKNTFILDIQAKAAKYLLSQKQIDALKNACKRERDKKKEAKHDIMPPDGRQEITGEVISIKEHDGHFGFSLKLTIKCEGYRLWGTCPKGLGASRGDRVTFTATVNPKEKGFGFFSRPTGGQVL